ncbi:MAG: hypothetical protein JO230_22340 [Xanthobacteraceae bacterium]|nr:hypothetical protein [Xanthobacteraceae bacterium]
MRAALLPLAAALAVTGLASGDLQAAPTLSHSIKARKIATAAERKQAPHARGQVVDNRSPITSFSSSSRLNVGLIHKSGK